MKEELVQIPSERDIRPVVQWVIQRNLTYLERSALIDLHLAVHGVEQRGVSGVLIEAGCAMGGSALVMGASKAQGRQFNVYDAFGMIPPPSDRDGPDVHQRYQVIKAGRSVGIGGELYYGYEPDLYGKVRDTFREYGLDTESNRIKLVKGLYEDVLFVHEPVALAHLDCDWYEPVRTCLERIVPRLTTGGVLVIDDYYTWSGCRDAVDEYFADKTSCYRFEKKSRLHITRAS